MAPPPPDGVSAYSTTSAGDRRTPPRGRSGATRTPHRRFWRPLLFQLSYTPSCARKFTIASAPSPGQAAMLRSDRCDDRFADLVARAIACRACPAMAGRRRVLGSGNGDPRASVLFVAE